MTNVFQESLQEAFENLFELSQKTMDKAAEGLLKKASKKRDIVKDLEDNEQYWTLAGRKTIDKLNKEVEKHSKAAANMITGK